MDEFDRQSLVGVLASDDYDADDYIRDYDEFRDWLAGRRAEDAPVPYLDLRRAHGGMRPELNAAIGATIESGQFIGGPLVADFERDFAAYCDTGCAVGVANGLEALLLALLAKGIGPGDEVLIPAHTFVATALAVTHSGATPVPVDVEEDTGNIDPGAIHGALSPRTRAIIPVHLYGHPADMDAIARIAASRGLFVLEDSAQAHGALYRNRRCGSLGDAAAFSFYPTKNLGAMGDAGAVTTANADLAAEVRLLGNYGSARRYDHERLGFNSRLDPIQAAVLCTKLKHLDDWNARRRALAARYLDGLSGLDPLGLPAVRPWATPVWHVFRIRVPDGRRDALRTFLHAHGVGTNIHYPVPVHRQSCYSNAGFDLSRYPVADRLAQQTLSLPLDARHTHAEVDRVIDLVRAFFAYPPLPSVSRRPGSKSAGWSPGTLDSL